MILVCGGLADIVTELMCSRLEHMGYNYHLLDQGWYPDGFTVAWTWDGEVPAGTIATTQWSLDLAQLTGVFVRYIGKDGRAPMATVPADLEDAAIAECQAGLSTLLEHLPCPVANRAAGSMSNHSKPYQALIVRQTGLRTPRTLITSDPAAARAFYEACGGEVIFKSLSGLRSVVRRMEPRDLDRLMHLRQGVAQFQEFVPGENIRVHTVGDALFATRVLTQAVDYRYAERQGHHMEMEPTTVPEPVAAACHKLASALNLVIAGIDLKETPDGSYYCFEVNPSPGFAFYEQRTGQAISAALAEVLRGSHPQCV
jgi:glutathione synthase/RimK-type ligase-like ATP-grasp enzyme